MNFTTPEYYESLGKETQGPKQTHLNDQVTITGKPLDLHKVPYSRNGAPHKQQATATRGVKYDQEKLRPSLLPMESVIDVIKVLMFGSKKYADDNWKIVPDAHKRYKDASMRHLMAYFAGEKNDEETGLSHLSHCVCCLLFMIWFDLKEAQK